MIMMFEKVTEKVTEDRARGMAACLKFGYELFQPFDLDSFKQGALCCDPEGRIYRFISVIPEATQPDCRLVTFTSGSDAPTLFCINGKYNNNGNQTNRDLVMAPIAVNKKDLEFLMPHIFTESSFLFHGSKVYVGKGESALYIVNHGSALNNYLSNQKTEVIATTQLLPGLVFSPEQMKDICVISLNDISFEKPNIKNKRKYVVIQDPKTKELSLCSFDSTSAKHEHRINTIKNEKGVLTITF